jgi:alcohol/geraniol dehydrogenase (NADP+)
MRNIAMQVKAWAASAKGESLKPFSYHLGPLGAEQVDVEVEYCGICHSDWSVLQNDWQNTVYPVVPGHEVVGKVIAAGSAVKGLKVGQRVGIGWNVETCRCCKPCVAGNGQLCAQAQATIIGHHGGFGSHVRSHWAWAIPIPEALEPGPIGPLLCGGITVFGPLLQYGISPTSRAGVVGIGGLGHMAVKFLKAWGCEVTAFTSSPAKFAEAKTMGAHRTIASKDEAALKAAAGSLDFLIVTVNVPMNWSALMQTLGSQGRLHIVGAVLEPIPIASFDLIMAQRSVSGSPTGSADQIATMLQFAARHQVLPQVEYFPLSKVNEALEHLHEGKARYRVVLDAKK